MFWQHVFLLGDNFFSPILHMSHILIELKPNPRCGKFACQILRVCVCCTFRRDQMPDILKSQLAIRFIM